MFRNSPSICYIFFAIDQAIVTSINTYTSKMGISNEGNAAFQTARKSSFPSSFFRVPSSERFSELGSRNSEIY